MFNVILAATDGSEHGRKAVHMAAQLAAAHDAKLLVLTVQGHGEVPQPLRHMAEVEHLVRPERVGTTAVVGTPVASMHNTGVQYEQVHRVIAERIMDEACGAARALGVSRCEGFVETGTPAERIVARATSASADLVVMGTRGLSDLKGLLMGSVSHRVCQQTSCPCLTVK